MFVQWQSKNKEHPKRRWERAEICLFAIPILMLFAFYGWRIVSETWFQPLPPPLHTLKSQAYIHDLVFSPDGKTLVSGSSHEKVDVIEFWDVQTAQLKFASKTGGPVYVGAVAYSPNGRIVAAGYGGYVYPVKLWDTRTGKLLRTLRGHTGNVDWLAFLPDGQRLISVSGDERAFRVWDIHKGRLLKVQKLPGIHKDSTVRASAVSPDCKLLATAVWRYVYNYTSEIGDLWLWDVETGKLIHKFPEQPDGVFGLAFSPDGRRLASANYDTTIAIWNLKSKTRQITLEGHDSPVTSVAFSTDGKYLVSGSGDNLNDRPGEVIVWDSNSGQLLKLLTRNDAPVYSVVFSPDGNKVASSHDEKVKIWDVGSLKVWQHQRKKSN